MLYFCEVKLRDSKRKVEFSKKAFLDISDLEWIPVFQP